MGSWTKPEIRYARSGNIHIAYGVWGEGPPNIVATPGAISHLDYLFSEPGAQKYWEGLGRFARVTIFDKRGTGLSDRQGGVPTFEERMDDIRAVMDAAGFNDAILLGHSEGVAMSILFAASYPKRTKGLILYGGYVKGLRSPDYPWASTKEEYDASIDMDERAWGTKEWEDYNFSASSTGADYHNDAFRRWEIEATRMGASPGASVALTRSNMAMDIRSILPAIHVPTLILHRVGDNIEQGRYIAGRIPGAKLVELPGTFHWFATDPIFTERVLGEIREFVLSVGSVAVSDRMLTTVMFTDIVDSTKKAALLGDNNWQNLLDRHNLLVSNEVRKFNGAIVKNTGDGFLATFDGPTRAIRCAWGITRASRDLGIEVRAGLHTGECIIGPGDVSGIAIHLASRILNEAASSEVMVSGTVKDLVYGSGISFRNRGEYTLKGIEEKRDLYSVENVP